MATVIERSADDLRVRIHDLLERLGMSREEVQERADAGLLTGPEFWLYEELLSVEWLLEDE